MRALVLERFGRTVSRTARARWTLVPGLPVTFNPLLACGFCSACIDGQQQYRATRRMIGVISESQTAFAEFVAVPAQNVIPLSPGLPAEYRAFG